MASSQGKAMAAPTPRKSVRLDSCFGRNIKSGLSEDARNQIIPVRGVFGMGRFL